MMRLAQLNPKNLVMNIIQTDVTGDARLHSHENIWRLQEDAELGKAAPFIALAENEVAPEIGQRWTGSEFVDDAEWLSEHSRLAALEALELEKATRLALKDLELAKKDPDSVPMPMDYYQSTADACTKRAATFRDKSKAFAERAAKAK